MRARKSYRYALVAGSVALLLAGGWVLWGETRAPVVPPEPVKIRFATTRFLAEAPSFVADEKGYFREEGLEVSLHNSNAGWQSLKRLFQGEADIATVAELPLVYASMDRTRYTTEPAGDFVILADMKYPTRVLAGLARRDRGIRGPADLRGKTIGVPRGTTVDFLLDNVLLENRLTEADVRVRDIGVAELPAAIEKGEIDALFAWPPHWGEAKRRLGDNAVTLDTDRIYPSGWLIVAMKDYALAHPEVMTRFLRAIAKGGAFVKAHPAEARAIYVKHTGADPAVVAESWGQIEFDLTLSESLLVMMDSEARWAIRRGLSSAAKPPNYLDYLYQEPIRRVNPHGVTIVQ